LALEPTIYLVREYGTEDDVHEVSHKLCEEIFVEQLAGWFRDEETWPQNPSVDMFCRWFDFQHHSMLVGGRQDDLRNSRIHPPWGQPKKERIVRRNASIGI
jgi:hypothetical protein